MIGPSRQHGRFQAKPVTLTPTHGRANRAVGAPISTLVPTGRQAGGRARVTAVTWRANALGAQAVPVGGGARLSRRPSPEAKQGFVRFTTTVRGAVGGLAVGRWREHGSGGRPTYFRAASRPAGLAGPSRARALGVVRSCRRPVRLAPKGGIRPVR